MGATTRRPAGPVAGAIWLTTAGAPRVGISSTDDVDPRKPRALWNG